MFVFIHSISEACICYFNIKGTAAKVIAERERENRSSCERRLEVAESLFTALFCFLFSISLKVDFVINFSLSHSLYLLSLHEISSITHPRSSSSFRCGGKINFTQLVNYRMTWTLTLMSQRNSANLFVIKQDLNFGFFCGDLLTQKDFHKKLFLSSRKGFLFLKNLFKRIN